MVVFAHVADTLNGHRVNQLDGWIGGAGVDIFFVISGYIMARLMDLPKTGPAAAADYLARRISRIVPIYWLVTMTIFALWWATRADMFTRLNPDNAFAKLLNSLLFLPQPIVIVGWTLSYEMAFYALTTASLLLPWNRAMRFAFVISILLTVAAIFIAQVSPLGPTGLPNRAMVTEFAVGMGVYLLTSKRMFSRWFVASVFAAGTVCLWLVRHDHGIGHGHPAWVFGAGSIVFASIAAERMIRWPNLTVRLGDASYSIYLTHLYVVVLLNTLFRIFLDGAMGKNPLLSLAFGITCLAATCVMSLALYRTIERPLTSYFQKRFAPLIAKLS